MRPELFQHITKLLTAILETLLYLLNPTASLSQF